MRFVFLSGGLAGFLTATISGLSAGRSPDSVFLSATVSALAGGLLFRWFWTLVIRGIRDTYVDRQRAAELALEARKKT